MTRKTQKQKKRMGTIMWNLIGRGRSGFLYLKRTISVNVTDQDRERIFLPEEINAAIDAENSGG